jgi:hypothetical protein
LIQILIFFGVLSIIFGTIYPEHGTSASTGWVEVENTY